MESPAPMPPARQLPGLWVCQCTEFCSDATSAEFNTQQVVCAGVETAADVAAKFCALRSECGACQCECMGPYLCE